MMIHRNVSNIAVIGIALTVFLVSGIYTFQQRYFFRFIPLPIGLADVINDGNWLLPSSQSATLAGALNFGDHDLQTEEGLRKTLNAIRDMSPFKSTNGVPTYDGINFENWVEQIKIKPIFCTDGTLLFILAAHQQGLAAREWHLLPPGWPPGQGHSVAEFFNPSVGQWQLVDAQQGAIVRGPDDQITNMLAVLKAYKDDRPSDVRIDYGPYREIMVKGAQGPTENYFFTANLLRTPVLQLRSPTWFATVTRNFGLSGHFVIGYPIIVDGMTHDARVWLTKVSALMMLLSGGIAFLGVFSRFWHLPPKNQSS